MHIHAQHDLSSVSQEVTSVISFLPLSEIVSLPNLRLKLTHNTKIRCMANTPANAVKQTAKEAVEQHNWCYSMVCLLCRAHGVMGWIGRWRIWKEEAELTVNWLSRDTENPTCTHRNLDSSTDSLLKGLRNHGQQSWLTIKAVSKSAKKRHQWL